MDFVVNIEWALFYGILLGDGYLSRSSSNRQVVITCNMRDDKRFFDEIVIPLVSRLREKPVVYRLRPDWNKIEINFSDKILFNKTKSLRFPVGKKGNISIPSIFPKRLWKHIIAGVFATDGSLVFANNNGTLYPRIEIHCTARELLIQIKDFLIDNGIRTHVYRIEGKRENEKTSYRLESPGPTNLVNFRKVMGFVNPKQENKFNIYMYRRKNNMLKY